ncbi:nucleoside/nucleotide kinase family protein [Marinilactibacillus kalidii]|uniref:nucleoside/nucleotide kinase family protein n=1 Tax=Marinilactibacillus kalidii TaxID=2820274 RepID=UPI001ABE22EB|nr:nucleoside/nucleotide kinase family protein [Marinilactibacillus kalidii]
MNLSLNVNGLTVDASYTKTEIDEQFIPLLEKIDAMKKIKNTRIVVYLAAPPGTGKTTLSQFLEILYNRLPLSHTFQSISIDGFHYPNAYLTSHNIEIEGKSVPLKTIKGSPESFDLKALRESCATLHEHSQVEWPLYDRKLHDVSSQRLKVDADIVLVEGNWLLLDEPGWGELKALADLTIFIEAQETALKSRLINRKMMGGLSKEAAEAFYEQSDGKNVKKVLNKPSEPDIYWKMQNDGTLKEG